MKNKNIFLHAKKMKDYAETTLTESIETSKKCVTLMLAFLFR